MKSDCCWRLGNIVIANAFTAVIMHQLFELPQQTLTGNLLASKNIIYHVSAPTSHIHYQCGAPVTMCMLLTCRSILHALRITHSDTQCIIMH